MRLRWALASLRSAIALGVVALHRGDSINAGWLILAAVCTYAVAFRLYSRFLAYRVMQLDDARVTPAVQLSDGKDFVPTNRWVLFGHHFAAIAGAGPRGTGARRAVRLSARRSG